MRVALGISILLLLALVPALMLAPVSLSGAHLIIALSIGGVAVIAYANQVLLARYVKRGELTDRLRLDAGGAIVVIALAFAGPLVAFALDALPEITGRVRGRKRVALLPRLANLASYGWGLMAATGVLALLGHPVGSLQPTPSAIGAVALAGAADLIVNYFITRGLVAMVADAQPIVATIRRELVPALPSIAIMVATAGISVALTATVGALGLLPLLLAVAAPQLSVAVLGRLSPSASTLEVPEASTRYAVALADQLGLSRRQRQVVHAASRDESDTRGRIGGLHEIGYDVGAARFYRDEHFDGGGWLGIYGQWIPLESRVLAFARAWAELTARGTSELSHAAAIKALAQQQADSLRFDPRVLAAATDLTGAELVTEPATRRVPAVRRVGRQFAQLAGAR